MGPFLTTNPLDVMAFRHQGFWPKFIVQGIDANVCLRYNGAVINEGLLEDR